MARTVFMALALICATHAPAQAQSPRVYDNDIVDAYEYMLARWLVLRQEAADLKDGFKWNEMIHRNPAGTNAADPNFDVVISEAWIGVDETSCTLVELPEISDRYFTLQIINGWGEVTANINERTYPKHPYGRFALCLKDAKVTLPKDPPPPRAPRQPKVAQQQQPKGATQVKTGQQPKPPQLAPKPVQQAKPAPLGIQRVDLPSRKSHVILRIALGDDPAEAVALQKQVTMKTTGTPKIDKAVVEPAFTNAKLPGVEIFEKTDEILASESDINNGVSAVQAVTRSIAKAVADPAERTRIDDVVRKRAIPYFLAEAAKTGRPMNGWMRPRVIGNYRTDYEMRTIANFTSLWANSGREMVTYTMQDMDGSRAFTQSFPADGLPSSKVRYFWSLVIVDAADRRVIANPLKRYVVNAQSDFQPNTDNSFTLTFAPKLPAGAPESNWMPTQQGKKYNITYRFYGPAKDVADGNYAPPPLLRAK